MIEKQQIIYCTAFNNNSLYQEKFYIQLLSLQIFKLLKQFKQRYQHHYKDSIKYMNKTDNNAKFQALMLSPPNNNSKTSSYVQKQRQSSVALGMQSEIADEGHAFSEQLVNIQYELLNQNKEQFPKSHIIKPQTYNVAQNHNISLLTKNKENNVNFGSENNVQMSKQSNSQIMIKNYFKIVKIQQIKTYQMIAKMSRNQQSGKNISLIVRTNQNGLQDDIKKRQINSGNGKLNQFRDFPIPFKYQFDGNNPLNETLVPVLISKSRQNQNINDKQQQIKSEKLLMVFRKNKYLFNIPLNFNEAEYFIKLKVNLQRSCGFCLYYVNKYQQKSKNFKYEIVKLMHNILRIRCLILIDNQVQKVWKQLQVPIVQDSNVHIPQNIKQNSSLLQISIQNIDHSHSVLKLNQFQISLNLQHPYQEASYVCIDTDPNGVQIRQFSIQSGKSKKENDISLGGCDGECKII